LWQADTGTLRDRLWVADADEAIACTRLRDGTPVALTPLNRGIRLWDLVSGKPRDVVLAGHSGELLGLDCVTHDGVPILVTDAPVRAWDVETGQPYGPPLDLELQWPRLLSGLQFPDGTLQVALVDHEQMLRIWDPRSGGQREPVSLEDVEANAMAITQLRDMTPVAVIACNRHPSAYLLVYDLTDGRKLGPLLRMNLPYAGTVACTRLPDDTTLAAVGGDDASAGTGVVEVWDLDERRALHLIRTPEPVVSLHFTSAHRLVVRTYFDVTVYDVH
jgi:WD40 repeat protein